MIPKQDYQVVIDTIKRKDLIPSKYKSQIVVDDFRGLPIEDEFQKLFNFYQGNILRHYNYGIKPGLFFYNSSTSINAFAAKWNDHFIISFNKGTLMFLKEKYKSNRNLEDAKGLETTKQIFNKSDYPMNELMYQLCGNFTFYHELGHLIQKSEHLDDKLNEDVTSPTFFDLASHIREYDADIFSGICLGTHLYQYIVNWCPDVDDNEANKIIGAITASIFLYLLSFPSANKPLYFKAESHPHPIIRIMGILFVISDYVEMLSAKKKKLVLSKKVIMDETFSIAESIADQILDTRCLKNFKEVFKKNSFKIINYNKELMSLISSNKSSAFNKRNVVANK